MQQKIYPFYRPSEYSLWRAENCLQCHKNGNCYIQDSLKSAVEFNTRMPMQIAKQIGVNGNRVINRCNQKNKPNATQV